MPEIDRLERGLSDLYRHVLLEALSGPFARRLWQELGNGLVPMWRTLLDRQDERLNSESAIPIDDIDWAAIRVVAPAMLRLYDESTLHATAGHTLADLAELELRRSDLLWGTAGRAHSRRGSSARQRLARRRLPVPRSNNTG